MHINTFNINTLYILKVLNNCIPKKINNELPIIIKFNNY